MLGSGSAGNSALVATDHCKILVDGGLSARQLVLRLEQCGVTPEQLDGARTHGPVGSYAWLDRQVSAEWVAAHVGDSLRQVMLHILSELTIIPIHALPLTPNARVPHGIGFTTL
jgi:hypothetical protein